MLVITPWICSWLPSEELKALSLLISSLSPNSQRSGSVTPVSQVSVCCESLWVLEGTPGSPGLGRALCLSLP